MKNGIKKRFFSAAIPYVNAAPHLGHALEFVQLDALGRYYRLAGDDVFVCTGTDENSLKNVRAAEKEGISVVDLVERNAAVFKKLQDDLNIQYDDFIRTREGRHIKGVEKLWKASSKDMHKKKYQGLYCVGCEEFYKPDELLGDGVCPEHQKKPEIVSEINYFFKLPKYSDILRQAISSDTIRILPEERKNEVLSFIDSGLEDFCVSRSSSRARGWGIPVPGDDSEIIWVWYDALSNYINAIEYWKDSSFFQAWWEENQNTTHLIGKGILRFHAVYWPVMLMSAGVSPPKNIFVHGYITIEGAKMSKSLGNVIDPFEALKWRGTDALRWYFLREIPTGGDGDFSRNRFQAVYESELADNLGNLVSRVAAMAEKYRGSKVPDGRMDGKTADFCEKTWKTYREGFEDFNIKKSMEAVLEFLTFLNKYVDEKKPWVLAKAEESRKGELDSALFNLLEGIRQASLLLYPAMPETARKISKIFGVPLEDSMKNQKFGSGISAGQKLQLPKPLFPKSE